ncbi:MAG TPA: large conductance mechanosensitive channel protein MscL [Candidatus Dormibacteraeota bacterium]
MKGFREFVLRGNVVDLAVAFVIGAAFGVVVAALVKDFVTPLIAAIFGKPDFSSLYFTINSSKFLYGDFINALLAFVLIAAVVYFFVVVPYTAFQERYAKGPAPEPTKECPECLSAIPERARRCMYCASEQTQPA